jgi:hypothetical protein
MHLGLTLEGQRIQGPAFNQFSLRINGVRSCGVIHYLLEGSSAFGPVVILTFHYRQAPNKTSFLLSSFP